MEVTNSFFCDAATIDSSGKLSVLGVFSNIATQQFPTAHPQMSFVSVIEGHRSEIGVHQIKINFINQDGQDILPPMNGSFEISTNRLDSTFIINIQGVQFPQAGTYIADIAVDNQHKRSVKLNVTQI